MHSGIDKAINYFGSQAELARQTDVKFQTIQVWQKSGVPIKRCVQIERLTGGLVTRKDLRPHDYHEIWVDLIEDEDEKG